MRKKNKIENITQIIEQTSEAASEQYEYNFNSDFNEKLDSGDLGEYELILKKPNGEEQQLEPISRALFTVDRSTYQTIKNDVTQEEKEDILQTDYFPSNEASYDRLLSILKRQTTIIPFVGAGFSVSAGCPTWSDYIVGQAERARMKNGEIVKRIENGEQEQVMDEVIKRQTIDVFQRDFRSSFEGAQITPSLSPGYELLGLIDTATITINFDRVIEDCHSSEIPFTEKVLGAENNGRFLKAIFQGEKYLLKVHGNIDEQENRVLTKEEYDNAYGKEDIDLTLPIPRTLSRIFCNFTTLFLGCSLLGDRYMSILKKVYEQGNQYIPEHFAILSAPDDEEKIDERDKFLASHGVTPIWFPEGDWNKPSEILKLLKKEK